MFEVNTINWTRWIKIKKCNKKIALQGKLISKKYMLEYKL